MSSVEELCEKFPALARFGKAAEGDIDPVYQTATADCGAASLAMVLAFYGRHVTLEDLRTSMSVGRDGVSARAIVEAASLRGLDARGLRIEVKDLEHLPKASILHVGFSHFVVFDRIDKKGVHVVDPAIGRRTMTLEETGKVFTGVALVFEKSATFTRNAKPQNPIWRHLRIAVKGSHNLGRIVVFSLMLQLLTLLFPLLQGRLVDRVLPRNDLHLLTVLLVGLGVTVVFYTLATITRSQLLLYLRTRFDARLTLGFVEHMLRLPYDFFERRHPGDLQMRVGSVSLVREVMTGAVMSGLIDGVLVVSHLVFLWMMSTKMLCVALVVVLLQGAVHVLTRRKLQELSSGSLAKQADAANSLNEVLVGIESLKSSGCEHAASQTWAAQYVDVMNINLRRGAFMSASEGFLSMLNVVGPMVLLVAGTADVMEHKMSFGTMLSANAMAVGFIHPMMNLISTLQHLVMTRVHLTRIDDVLSLAPEQTGANKVAHDLAGEIALDHVTFRYGPKLPAVVNNVSVRVKPGECIAIVGSSGSGKTTLGRILLGLYAPSAGTVRFDGIATSQLDVRSLRRQLGVVVQRPHIFGSTVRRNIALADGTVPLERVQNAATLACIHDDIVKMPMQYDTPVIAGGASLSGGQRQRIALARALVHEPAVLLLDEATSALDAATERAVNANLEKLACTRILIAHRLSTVKNADRILVMDEGRIVEEGTHAQLLAKKGFYAKLVAAQLGDGVETARPETREPRPAPRSEPTSGERPIAAHRSGARPAARPAPEPPRASTGGEVVRLAEVRRSVDLRASAGLAVAAGAGMLPPYLPPPARFEDLEGGVDAGDADAWPTVNRSVR